MNIAQKNLLVAITAGLIIVAAAAFAIIPAKAAPYNVAAPAKVVVVLFGDQGPEKFSFLCQLSS